MDAQDVNEFLAGIKMAVMATINYDGSPHLSPNCLNKLLAEQVDVP